VSREQAISSVERYGSEGSGLESCGIPDVGTRVLDSSAERSEVEDARE
jgi:hypothetical protein